MAHGALVMVTPLGAGPCAPYAPLLGIFLQGGEVWGVQGPRGSITISGALVTYLR